VTRIVTYARRPKRAPRKKAQAAAITGPAIVTAASKRTPRQVAVGWRRMNDDHHHREEPASSWQARRRARFDGRGVSAALRCCRRSLASGDDRSNGPEAPLGAATATTNCRPPRRPSPSRSAPSRRGTDPYARWCGRGGVVRRPPIPIEGGGVPHHRARFAVCRKELPNPEPSRRDDHGFVEATSLVRGIWRTGCTSWPCCGC
jgi:hypothetical protein